MATFGHPRNQANYISFERFGKSYTKRYLLLNCVKSYGYVCQILAIFTMPTHQILSCHVTQAANFENV